MLYKDFLKSLRACPFCDLGNRHLKTLESAYLTYALAPYHKHHLLVAPKRHSTTFLDLTNKESVDILQLLRLGALCMNKLGYNDYSILIREGRGGRSIPHLHYHIIPADVIGDLTHAQEERVVLSEREINDLCDEIGSALRDI